jgi:crotonobetainyl-CoA:carnitine CoA-transferase CaiB-like acyl-CoA transferase
MASGRPSPRLGEHSRDILQEIGMDQVSDAAQPRPARKAVSG